MSTTQMGTAQTGRTDARREDDVRRGFVAGSTEARPGIMTTEFWLSIAMATAVIVAGYFSDALNVARGEIGGLAVERATFINDFEGRQNPVLLDIVEFDGFIWEPDRNRRH